MSAIETRGNQNSDAVDSPALTVAGTDPARRLSPPDAFAAENFSNALNRRAPLPADADVRDGPLFDLLAQLPWPDSTQGQGQSPNDAALQPASVTGGEMIYAAAPPLPANAEPSLATTTRGRHVPVQDGSPDTVPQTELTFPMERKISRKSNAIDVDRVPDAPPAIFHFTQHLPAAVDPSAAQSAYSDPARTELKMQEFHHLICQMGAQVAIDNRRSEVAVSLSHAMFSSTRLKIRGDKDSIEVGYECGSAEETDWFGSNADALVQRLSASLQRRVTIRPEADQRAM
ncbi:hypothetical protein [Noviherbaspirillum sp.]|uniref:hypothetical protein n=1 Tax=Noviherbaspirillum sp. TaxID=1926288 RepID=UPI002B4628F3|nr:hypothetical protein [Noviherbaspirillum sp.]HJV80572.1 hypothetical protein [Noviherbaspirillum sp.]